jgi:hypothetical protein
MEGMTWGHRPAYETPKGNEANQIVNKTEKLNYFLSGNVCSQKLQNITKFALYKLLLFDQFYYQLIHILVILYSGDILFVYQFRPGSRLWQLSLSSALHRG